MGLVFNHEKSPRKGGFEKCFIPQLLIGVQERVVEGSDRDDDEVFFCCALDECAVGDDYDTSEVVDPVVEHGGFAFGFVRVES